MTSIHAIQPTPQGADIETVWTQTGPGLAAGYTSLAPVRVHGATLLYAHDKRAQKTDLYTLSEKAPYVQLAGARPDLAGGPWDALSSFVLGNEPHLLAYRRADGTISVYRVAGDGTVSKPYSVALTRATPTAGFTTLAPFASLGQQYVLGYDYDTGTVAAFAIGVVTTSPDGVPPLRLANVWWHQWAKGWTRFAFFQLGGANFFFKINRMKLNVNIDHLQDDPSNGSVEVGSHLEAQLPDALGIDAAGIVPRPDGDPWLLTYVAATGKTEVHRIRPDCLGWRTLASTTTPPGAASVVPYRIGETSFALLYDG